MFKYSVGKNVWCLENNERKKFNMYVENCVLILLLYCVLVIENEFFLYYRDVLICFLFFGLYVFVLRYF